MCGIAGAISIDRTEEEIRPILDAMLCQLRHRGPDGCGMMIRRSDRCTVGLAHTRLSILDLSEAASQPMAGSGSPCWLVYNGEVYNFRELQRELKPLGCRFHSKSDTEVVLRAYEKWGIGCLTRFRGMFAFGVWDEALGQLALARDPFGIKPLYYYQAEDVFLFASELRALLASGRVPRRISVAALSSYLHYGSVEAPLAIIEGVRSLEPGHAAVVEPREGVLRVEQVRYAEDFHNENRKPAYDRHQFVNRLRTTIQDAVRMHLVSDVPVGVFLSGGLDSSALVAMISRVADEQPKTFTIDFGEKEFSEISYARSVAKQFGTEHTEILLSEDKILALLPDAFRAMDQPTMDGINTFVIAKAVRDTGVKVALSGLGGDELFAGYGSFRRARVLRLIGKSPVFLRSLVSSAGRSVYGGSVRRQKFWDLLASDGSARATYRVSRRLFREAETQNLLGQRKSGWLPMECSDPCRDVVNAISLCEVQGYMANTLLRDTDFMSMARGLEIRVPFLDLVVVRSVLEVPGAWKVSWHRQKPLLAEALRGRLPERILKRPKMGFTLPLERWMRSVLMPDIDSVLSDRRAMRDVGISPDFSDTVWQTFRKNPQKERWSRSWALYALGKWCELNGVRL